VAGWPGYRIWISTTTLPERHKITDELVDAQPRYFGRQYYHIQKIDLPQFVKSFSSPYDAAALIREMNESLTPFPIDTDREDLLLATLLEGADVYDWNPDDPNAPRRIANLLKLILELPEYQLN